MSLLPTVTAGEAKSRTYQRDGGDPLKPRLSLAGEIQEMLPTPCGQTQKGGARFEGGSNARKQWRKLLGTPRCADGITNGKAGRPDRSRLEDQFADLLPTPTREQYGSQSYPLDPSRKRPNLKGSLLATPTVNDSKNASVPPSQVDRNSMSLPVELQEGLGHSRRIGTAELLIVSEWMMGYPAGWLDRCLRPTATPCSPKSRKSSAGP